jgi:hypothetical protein
MDTDTLVDAATVAAKLGQAKSSIYRLAQAGLIPSYRRSLVYVDGGLISQKFAPSSKP